MRLIYDAQFKAFVFICSYHERHIPREAGFRWCPDHKLWMTSSKSVARQLHSYVTDRSTEDKIRDAKPVGVPTHIRVELSRLYQVCNEKPECTVCLNTLDKIEPDEITLCGHIVCGGCRSRLGDVCPVCRTDLGHRNLLLV